MQDVDVRNFASSLEILHHVLLQVEKENQTREGIDKKNEKSGSKKC